MKDKINTINVDIEVVYYWFDLDNGIVTLNGDDKIIEEAILNGDFTTFIKYQQYYNYEYKFDNHGGNITFFPNEALIYYNDIYVGQIFVTNETGFNMITEIYKLSN